MSLTGGLSRKNPLVSLLSETREKIVRRKGGLIFAPLTHEQAGSLVWFQHVFMLKVCDKKLHYIMENFLLFISIKALLL